MLDSIKEELKAVNDLSFNEFFQQYVMAMQDKLINDHIKVISHYIHSIDDINGFDKSISNICEEFMEDIYD